MSPAVLLVRPPDKSVCQRLLLLRPKVLLLLLLLLVMEAVAWVRVETVLAADALEYKNHIVRKLFCLFDTHLLLLLLPPRFMLLLLLVVVLLPWRPQRPDRRWRPIVKK